MSTVAAVIKQTIEKKRYTMRYTRWLEGAEAISDFLVSISPITASPLIANGAFTDVTGTKVSVFLSGGLAGVIYTVSFIVTTTQGQVKRDDLQMQVV